MDETTESTRLIRLEFPDSYIPDFLALINRAENSREVVLSGEFKDQILRALIAPKPDVTALVAEAALMIGAAATETKPTRRISPEGIERIRAAQRRRWAKHRKVRK